MGDATDNQASTAERLAQGLAVHKQGRLAEARRLYLEVLDVEADNAEALHLLGIVAYQQGEFDQALERVEAAIRLRPDVAKYHSNRGNALKGMGRIDEAVAAYRQAIGVDPGFADAHFNLGVALRDGGDDEGAAKAFQAVLKINPAHLDAKQNLATVFRALDRNGQAIDLFREVLKARRDSPELHYNLSQTLEGAGRYVEAIAESRAALELSPGYMAAAAALYFQLRLSCTWDGLAEIERLLDADIDRAEPGRRLAETPFIHVGRCGDAARNLAVSRSWGADMERRTPPLFQARPRSRRPDGRIRIGYLSADIWNHATAHLTRGLFGRHDRRRFHITMYSHGRDDGSHYRRDIAQACDAFVDVRELTHTDAARRIHADGIDILVELNGWAGASRLAVCACRPAPIQVTYLGFPGTTGCRFIDYAIVDPVVAPSENAAFFSEALVRMPHCYQVNDIDQAIAAGDLSRAGVGLPAEGLVFCSFVTPYKIDAVIFDVWMRLLRRVPGSVLWLLDAKPEATANLKAEAERRGIPADRLVFGRSLPKDRHLQRVGLADLALDTRVYTGHTTSSDTLFAGVPIVTTMGRHFASRVSASCLKAVGLDDMVTSSLEDYEALAFRLATDADERQRIRKRLAENRGAFPLFDTALFARHLDSAFEIMWRRFEEGRPPESFAVAGEVE